MVGGHRGLSAVLHAVLRLTRHLGGRVRAVPGYIDDSAGAVVVCCEASVPAASAPHRRDTRE